MEEVEGFEPPRAVTPLSVFKTDPFSRTWVYLQLRNGREDRIRTCDPLVPNQVLYQAELLPVFQTIYLLHHYIYGAPDRSRTHNLLIRSQTLYPIELRARI